MMCTLLAALLLLVLLPVNVFADEPDFNLLGYTTDLIGDNRVGEEVTITLKIGFLFNE